MKKKIKTVILGNKSLNILARKVQRFKRKYRKSIIGRNNTIVNNGVLLNVKYDIIGDGNYIEIMQGALLSDTMIYMRGSNHKLKIGTNCHFRGGEIWFEDNNCQIKIGSNTTIESAHLAVTEPNKSIIIGEDCMFSKSIEFRTGDSHSIIDLGTKKRINYSEDIRVGNHVWIGKNSTLLKGANIGNNSIIGINSIVTNSIPNNSIAAGIPAKVIRNNIDWRRERIYSD